MADYRIEFLQVAVAHLLAVASPGPDFAIVLRQAVASGRRSAVFTSFGIGTAILLHVTYSLLGLGLLIRGSETWFNVVKYTGAVYIAWIGVQALRARPQDKPDEAPVEMRQMTMVKSFALGFLTNALNPKATLFFISLFALVVSPHTPKWVQAGYGLWMAGATAGWFCLVSAFFTQPGIRRKFLRHGHWIDRVLGVVFLGFAASLVLATIK